MPLSLLLLLPQPLLLLLLLLPRPLLLPLLPAAAQPHFALCLGQQRRLLRQRACPRPEN